MTAALLGLLIILSLAAQSAQTVQAQQDASTEAGDSALEELRAIVTNGTEGGAVPEGLIVTLQVFDLTEEDTELQRLEAETRGNGMALFPGVIADHRKVSYTLSAEHNGIRFFSDAYISALMEAPPLELVIYEMTSDPSVIRIIGDSSAITPPDDDSGVLRVLQVTTFENTSDRAYAGNDPFNTRLTIQMPLPVRAFDLDSVHSPGSLVLAPDSRNVHSIVPVMPGVYEQIVTYGVLYTTNVLAWSKTYPYPTEIARLLVPKELSFRPGSDWVRMDDSEVSDVVYARYEMRAIIAGETLTGTIADLPSSAGSRSRGLEQTLRDVALGVVAASLMIVAAFVLWWVRFRNRRRGLAAAPGGGGTPGEREAAIAELARLDDARDSGAISEVEYAQASAQTREILRRILEQERRE